mgnify:CR=1 FL=1|tara:strand:- start:41008 stop:41616 length:609 start_codon:yes stop_codon:yes gene_type:complete
MLITPFVDWIIKINIEEIDNKKVINSLKKLKYNNVYENNRPGSQISTSYNILDIIDNGAFIKKILLQKINNALEKYSFETKVKLGIVWGSKTPFESFSDYHWHTNHWLSAVYYPQGTTENPNYLGFRKRKLDNWYTSATEKNLKPWTQEKYVLTTVAGDLVIFPACYEHRVEINNSFKNRFSIAMVCMPVGKIGVGDGQNYL